jgi:hypothetical protein
MSKHFIPRHREDVADQHFFEVLGLRGGFAHGQDGRRRRHRVADADDGFLRDAHAAAANRREDRRAHEGEAQADPIRAPAIWIQACQDGDGCAQSRNLRQRQVDENHAAFYHVDAQVGVDSRQNEAGHEGREQEREGVHEVSLFRLGEGRH